jgi:oligopeptide transport system substrate-binding protein
MQAGYFIALLRRFGASALGLWVVLLIAGCGGATPWNSPYPAKELRGNVMFSAFDARPKHLDPARSYSANEYRFIGQIYEPPLQYQYLKRPYTLIPATVEAMPRAEFFDDQGNRLPDDVPPQSVAYTVYEIHVRPGIRYQPHPAFAVDAAGRPLYQHLTAGDLQDVNTLADFPKRGTRELTAADYVYEIKRLAHPQLHSPIVGLMSDHIVGMKEYQQTLQKVLARRESQDEGEHQGEVFIDLDKYSLEGATVVDRYTYRIKIRGVYPQFLYWLSMPFFAPLPKEVDHFYAQPGMAEKNITLDWYPVGTGPYMLTVNNPNRRMVLERNPNFHDEKYPSEGEPGDKQAGLLEDAGKPLPFIDKVVYSLEKETIPGWNKFLQGYYDASGISSDSFDQAVRIDSRGEATLTPTMKEKGIHLKTAVSATTFYLGFNMLDPVVGGLDERGRKLRQAISIAIDEEEFISIFLNGRGIPAQGPFPPGIFGYREGKAGIDPYVYDWVNGAPRRKSLAEARRLLAEAGYPNGIDAKTGAPLLLHLDIAASGPDDKARLDWYLKQFQKINVQLDIRNTDYNRFQDKIQKGTAQIYFFGWNADYPDPENFLFLLYGPNAKVKSQGENVSNYDNPEFNKLFDRMKDMPNTPDRQAVIDRMVDIARRDAPWVWGFHPKGFSLYHSWLKNAKPNLMANNTLKYLRIDPQLRARKQAEWNQPVLWPFAVVLAVLVAGSLPAVAIYRRRLHTPIKRS